MDMGTDGKILGQNKPAADTDVALYTVPAATEGLVSVFVCNVSAVLETFRVGTVKSGNALDWDRDAIMFDVPVNPNSTTQVTGLALGAGEAIHVRSGDGGVVFNAIGLETT